MAQGDFRNYSDPTKNNFTRTFGLGTQQSTIPRGSEAEFYKGYNSTGKGYATGPGYPQAKFAGVDGGYANTAKDWANKNLGTAFNQQGLVGTNYMYTGDNGMQGSLDMSGIDASRMTPDVIDAINNPMQGSEAGGMFGGLGGGVSMGGVAQGLGAAAQLANAYMGYKNYGLAKDKFDFEKAATNRSIANQASEYNAGVQNRGDLGLAIAGDRLSPEQRVAEQTRMQGQMISGAAIG